MIDTFITKKMSISEYRASHSYIYGSNNGGVTNVQWTFIREHDHPLLTGGRCYEYDVDYDSYLPLPNEETAIHYVYCDAPPEISPEHLLIYNMNAVYKHPLIKDSINNKPQIATAMWLQNTDYMGRVHRDTMFSISLFKRDSIDIQRLKADLVERIDSQFMVKEKPLIYQPDW